MLKRNPSKNYLTMEGDTKGAHRDGSFVYPPLGKGDIWAKKAETK